MPKNLKQENLLIEIGTEEIPARFIQNASRDFKNSIVQFLKTSRVSFGEDIKMLFTPRRLTLFIPNVSSLQGDHAEKIKGPPVSIAVDAQGQWTQAAIAFAQKQGILVSDLVRENVDKGEYIFSEKKTKGKSTLILLKENLARLISSFRFPKSMRWGEGNIFFARPISWVVALLGKQVIPFKLESLASDRISYGLRWVKNSKISIPKADIDLYKKLLMSKGVTADIEDRLKDIQEQVQKVLGKTGVIHEENLDLLSELANLVESPKVGVGEFDHEFLRIPQALLSTAIQYHQKYLPVYDKTSGKLLSKFVVVMNGSGQASETVVRGNQRVLRARLADAAFFWDQDQKHKLIDRVEDLKHVVFQEKLGTYFDKKERLVFLSDFLSQVLKLEKSFTESFKRAAMLCKADLVTAMVGEFPALQGIMGGEYAVVSGESTEIANAIREHYLPLSGSEGVLPKTRVGAFLAFVDKLDTIIVAFKAGLMPTGSQDPYGLRRLSSGLLRILYENQISISLKTLIEEGFKLEPKKQVPIEPLLKFFQERLENLFLGQSFHHELIRTVIDRQVDNPARAYKIVQALQGMFNSSVLSEAIVIMERTSNMVKGQASIVPGGQALENVKIDESLLKEKEEIDLYRAYQSNYDSVSNFVREGHFVKGLEAYVSAFSKPLHVFFDKVLVNVKEEPIRQNRLVLLKKIHMLYAHDVADLSKVSQKSNK